MADPVAPPPTRRGRRPAVQGPALDRPRLVAALIEMARRGGMDALNVRPVAAALGVSPRLIYHHVADKEEMLALVTDEILRHRMPDLDLPDWEARLRAIVAAVHLAYRDYPGSAAFILSRSANRLDQPNALRLREAILAALRDAGVDEDKRHQLLVMFSVVVLGNIVVAEGIAAQPEAVAMAGGSVEAAFARSIDMLVQAIRAAASEPDR